MESRSKIVSGARNGQSAMRNELMCSSGGAYARPRGITGDCVYSVVSWTLTIVDGMHLHCQFVIDSPLYWKPVESS